MKKISLIVLSLIILLLSANVYAAPTCSDPTNPQLGTWDPAPEPEKQEIQYHDYPHGSCTVGAIGGGSTVPSSPYFYNITEYIDSKILNDTIHDGEWTNNYLIGSRISQSQLFEQLLTESRDKENEVYKQVLNGQLTMDDYNRLMTEYREELFKSNKDEIDKLYNESLTFKTDKNGEIVVTCQAEYDRGKEAILKLVEKVPDGYTSEQDEYIVDLSKQDSITITNTKGNVLGDLLNPKTGIISYLPVAFILLIALILYVYLVRKNKVFLLILLIIPLSVIADAVLPHHPHPHTQPYDFTIKKVDQDGNPMEGVEFEIYEKTVDNTTYFNDNYKGIIINNDFSDNPVTLIVNGKEKEISIPLFSVYDRNSEDLYYYYDITDLNINNIISLDIKELEDYSGPICGRDFTGKVLNFDNTIIPFGGMRIDIDVKWDGCKEKYEIYDSNNNLMISYRYPDYNLSEQFNVLGVIGFDHPRC